ncbi:MAG: MMPL family transporter [Rhizomicrobium sp.]
MRSFKIIACILVTLFVGLAITMALGLYVAHVFNIISIAFVALFVGIGVDFGIQFCVRYRHERFVGNDLRAALRGAGRGVGTPLRWRRWRRRRGSSPSCRPPMVGVAELGLVAGMGMIVAFALSISLLPALLMLANPAGEKDEVGYRWLAAVDRVMISHRRQVMGVALLAGAVARA